MKTIISILVILTVSFTSVNAQIAKTGSVGIGIGVPYGVFGLNGEYAVHKHFSLSAGIGTTVFAGLGYSLGARGYLKPAENKWRPRASIHYGVNGMVVYQESGGDLSFNGQKFHGLSVGAGILAMFGKKRKHGFDFELLYLVTTGGLQDEIDKLNESGRYTHIDTPSKIKFLLGYRYGF